ncbi:MAG: hypothetical protein RLZZ414_2023 [Bacteroidota bacterium]|jgi:hypothetical protein
MKYLKFLSGGIGKKIKFALEQKETLESERQRLQNRIFQINAELQVLNVQIMDDVKSEWSEDEIAEAKKIYMQQHNYFSDKDKVSTLFKFELDAQKFADKKTNMSYFKEFTLNLHSQFPSHSLEEIEDICLEIYKNNVVD